MLILTNMNTSNDLLSSNLNLKLEKIRFIKKEEKNKILLISIKAFK